MSASHVTPTKPPFFVLGAQRSGTTMLRLMLNSHPNLAVPHESKFIMAFYPRLAEYGDLAQRKNAERLLDDISQHPAVMDGEHIVDREAILAHPIRTFPDMVNAIMVEKAREMGKSRWGDKTPFYTPNIDILWKLFPDAKIIHLVRDGRDVMLSQRRIKWMPSSVPRLAQEWRWKATIAHKVGSVRGPKYFLEARFEDLVEKPEAVLRQITQFLEEPYAPEMLTYHQNAVKSMPTRSLQWHQSSVRSPDRTKVHAWKNKLSLADRIIFEEIAGDALGLFGYELERHPSTLSSRFKNLYYAVVKRW